MKLSLAVAAGFLLQAQPDAECVMEQSVPKDVRPFLARAANCNHWTGEEPYDRERRREIERNIRDLRCAAVPADEKRLRTKYAGSPQVLVVMDEAVEMLGWSGCRPTR